MHGFHKVNFVGCTLLKPDFHIFQIYDIFCRRVEHYKNLISINGSAVFAHTFPHREVWCLHWQLYFVTHVQKMVREVGKRSQCKGKDSWNCYVTIWFKYIHNLLNRKEKEQFAFVCIECKCSSDTSLYITNAKVGNYTNWQHQSECRRQIFHE